LDTVLVSDLLDTASAENFGWGRSAVDGLARAGKFYIDANGNYGGDAPIAEAGFIQPRAERGRTTGFFAGSGPISCPAAFSVTDVPEPSSVLLLSVPLGGRRLRGRRR